MVIRLSEVQFGDCDLLIMSMITNRIGQHEVLLPIDQTQTKFEYWLFIFIHLHRHDVTLNCPITLSNYKHVVYNVLLVGLVMMSDNFVVVLLNIIITYVLHRPEGVYDNSYNPRGDKHCLPSAGIHATTDQCFRSNSGRQQ